MSRRKPLAALAVVTAALALVVSAAGASAATTATAAASPSTICVLLQRQITWAAHTNPTLAGLLTQVSTLMGC